jgi:hypothetical protein
LTWTYTPAFSVVTRSSAAANCRRISLLARYRGMELDAFPQVEARRRTARPGRRTGPHDVARRQRWGSPRGGPPSARRATARRTCRLRWLTPRRSLWHEKRLPASGSLQALSASGDAHAGASRLRRPVTRDARRGR